MFNQDFYPTPEDVIHRMLSRVSVAGKKVYEPEGGKGDLVEGIYAAGAAEVISSESDPNLRKILETKCKVISDDCLKVESHHISHVDFIIMNPPFSKAAEHIVHMFNIAPAGCKIISLLNYATIKNTYSKARQELGGLIEANGLVENWGDCFSKSERKTDVEVGMVELLKPGGNYDQEFDGFFLEEEEEEQTGAGIMSYNVVRDLVNRYIESVKIYDQQLETAVRLCEMQNGYFSKEYGYSGKDEGPLAITITRNGVPVARNDFKKRMQKAGWHWIFTTMNLAKYATKGLKEDINKFVEQQEQVPFTMRNVYKMLEIVVATSGQRMDKAILEVFDKVTKHYSENRFNLEGWKTNSHYLLNKRFICPHITEVGWEGKMEAAGRSSSNFEMLEDLTKALCYITGRNYSDIATLYDTIYYPYMLVKDGKYLNNPNYGHDVKYKSRSYDPGKYGDEMTEGMRKFPGSEVKHNKLEWGQWFDWGFFKVRAYKKGTAHIEFKDEDVWGMFNQRVAKLKGYPLAEKRTQTAYQKRNAGFQKTTPKQETPKKKPVILTTIKFNKAA